METETLVIDSPTKVAKGEVQCSEMEFNSALQNGNVNIIAIILSIYNVIQ